MCQRVAVAISCVLFYVLSLDFQVGQGFELAALVLLTVLACSEKLSSIMNLVSVEKDWVSIFPPSLITKEEETAAH